METPTLIPLDMSKAEKHEHPDINDKSTYLCQIGGELFFGKFQKQWFGWNYLGWYGVGLQFDAPNYNRSRWEQIWEVVRE